VIPVNEPTFTAREGEYLVECVRTGWVSSAGRFIDEFERGWASYCGRKHGIAVCNGSAALELAVASLNLSPGDEVIMPTFTIISCALAVLRASAVPVLVDSDPGNWTMDVRQVAEKITPRTRAIMAVHIYGHPACMDPIIEIADRYGLYVIEDAAEAHGAEYLSCDSENGAVWRRCGGFGSLSCFSFYGNKLITTGEGGMIVTDDDALAERARSLRNLCLQGDRRFYHQDVGYNFRMTNLQAALGVAQLERFNDIVAKKQRMGREYAKNLQGIPAIQLQTEESWARSVFWMFGIVITERTRMDAARLARELQERGVDTRPFFLGMHEQPVFRRRGWFVKDVHPVAERLSRQGLYLPSGLGLTDAQMVQVVEAVHGALDA
jgi:perosamine synthetase